MEYRDIGGWWDTKGYIDKHGNHQQCELDIVAPRLDGDVVEIYEVKRNCEKFDSGAFAEKLAYARTKENHFKRSRIVTGVLSLEDI